MPAYAPGAHIELHTGSDAIGLIVRHYSLIGVTEDRDDPRSTYRIAVQREDRGASSAFIHASFKIGTR